MHTATFDKNNALLIIKVKKKTFKFTDTRKVCWQYGNYNRRSWYMYNTNLQNPKICQQQKNTFAEVVCDVWGYSVSPNFQTYKHDTLVFTTWCNTNKNVQAKRKTHICWSTLWCMGIRCITKLAKIQTWCCWCCPHSLLFRSYSELSQSPKVNLWELLRQYKSYAAPVAQSTESKYWWYDDMIRCAIWWLSHSALFCTVGLALQ